MNEKLEMSCHWMLCLIHTDCGMMQAGLLKRRRRMKKKHYFCILSVALFMDFNLHMQGKTPARRAVDLCSPDYLTILTALFQMVVNMDMTNP